MRVKYSIINVSTGIISQIIITMLSFVSRTVFVGGLGVEYLGINGLFTNVLGMLSLAEAGIGSSIIFSLYKPISENDYTKINVLLNLYKNAFRIIALVVFLLGICLMPFLKYFIKGSTIPYVYWIYMIFLLNTVFSYLFSHKITILNVSQKGHIVTSTYTVSSILSTLIKIGIIFFTHNYILYIIIDIFITVTTSIFLSFAADRMYPYLKNKVTSKLDDETKGNIIKNIKALVLHNIGGYCVFGTDNLVISSFVSLTAVGLYSNYYMLINICRTLINQFFDNINHSLGNLIAEESKTKVYSVFKTTMLFNFWIYSFFTIFLFSNLEPFLSLWLGPKFLMGKSVLIILMINFYVSGMRRSITMVKTTSGIFHQDRYFPFIEATINLVFSIVLVRYIGITGVFIGTLISTLAVPLWTAPYLVFKNVFNKPVILYFKAYSYYAILGIMTCLITSFICDFFMPNNFGELILRATLCSIIPNLVYISIFRKTEEFKYLYNIAQNITGKIIMVMKKNRKEFLAKQHGG